jgi:cysteine-rich repeat protein
MKTTALQRRFIGQSVLLCGALLAAACSSDGQGGTTGSAGGAGGAGGEGGAGGGPAAEGCGDGAVDPGEECDDGNAQGDDGCAPTCTKSVAMRTVSLTPTDEDFPNPERGFYNIVNLVDGAGEAGDIKALGQTLAYAPVRLDDYRDKPLDDALFASLDKGFSAVRSAGIKVVLRFVYNDGFDPDAPKERVLEHIGQLKGTLNANADVIAVLQAGFIGAWGEWHSSTNGLENPEDRAAIVTAELEALPASRSVQIRTPMYKDEIMPGGPLAAAEAWTGSPRARTGHHNDCFLASTSDMGTYADPIAMWKQYVAEEGQFTPIGGETCAVNPPRTGCAEATSELASLHFSYLNSLYHPQVLDGWEAGGCMGDIRRKLGYRLVISEALFSESVAPGGALGVSIRLMNEGYASMFNQRPVFLVLGEGEMRRAALLSKVDPRLFSAGSEAQIKAWLRVPSDLAPGTYRLALWMPDEATSIQGSPDYAVRTANTGAWDPATGENVLAADLKVDPSAPGVVLPTATAFEEIP